MGQLTLARFRGDTAFAFIARIFSTFVGGIVGLVMWYEAFPCTQRMRWFKNSRYISAGSGQGNPYGLAATCAVCFPFFFYARLYWPISPLINLILWVTVILVSTAPVDFFRWLIFRQVIGYSYQDSVIQLPGSPGAGFSVAWARF